MQCNWNLIQNFALDAYVMWSTTKHVWHYKWFSFEIERQYPLDVISQLNVKSDWLFLSELAAEISYASEMEASYWQRMCKKSLINNPVIDKLKMKNITAYLWRSTCEIAPVTVMSHSFRLALPHKSQVTAIRACPRASSILYHGHDSKASLTNRARENVSWTYY